MKTLHNIISRSTLQQSISSGFFVAFSAALQSCRGIWKSNEKICEHIPWENYSEIINYLHFYLARLTIEKANKPM